MKLSKILNKKSYFLSHHKTSKLLRLPNVVAKTPVAWTRVYYKEYPRYPRIWLPEVDELESDSLYEVLLKRRSKRGFINGEVNLETISKLLFFSCGVNRVGQADAIAKRFYPSAGARYPLEIYIILLNATSGLKKGIYHYNVKLHLLEMIKEGSVLDNIRKIAGGVNRGVVENCPLMIVTTAVFGRTEIKYGESSYKLILLEAGHISQNLYLTSTALNMGCCLMGGFVDDKLNSLLEIDIEKEQALTLTAVGKLGPD